MKIIESFSRRMRYLDSALARLTQKAVGADEDVNHLFEVAEYYAKQSQFNQAYYAYYQYLRFCPNGMHSDAAKQRTAKIKPYSKAVYLEEPTDQFTRTYPKDTMIFAEAMPGKELYIIQKGQVKISKIINGNEVLLALLKPGDIFGEMALLDNKPRSASALAFEDSVLLAVNKENFSRMVTSQPQLITRLTTLLSERIWFIYKQLANTLLSDPVGKLYDALLIQLEKNRVVIKQNESYTFDFGPKELIHMVGLSKGEGDRALMEVIKNSRIKAMDGRIVCSDMDEILKQAQYYRKMQRIGMSRNAAGKK